MIEVRPTKKVIRVKNLLVFFGMQNAMKISVTFSS